MGPIGPAQPPRMMTRATAWGLTKLRLIACVSNQSSPRRHAWHLRSLRLRNNSEAIQRLRKRSRKGRGLGRTAPSLTGSSNAEPCNLDPAIFYMALSAGTRFDPDQSPHRLSGLQNAGVLAARNAMRPPLPDNNNSHPTPHDQFLYLLAEMEAAIERGTIQWDGGIRRIGPATPRQTERHPPQDCG